MSAFTPEQLASMQATQQAHMLDECLIGRFVEGAVQDAYGQPTSTYDWGYPTPCGLNFPAARYEALNGTEEPLVDARLRLPLGTLIGPRDQVRVTKRFGVDEITPTTYAVIGTPGAGPSGLIVKLKRATLVAAE